MKLRNVFPLIAVAVGLSVTAQAQSMTKGDILVIVADGEVTATDSASGVSTPLLAGTRLQEGFTISTGPDSAASLALANGSLVNLSESTTMEIRRFRIVPTNVGFDRFTGLVAEPTRSDTRLYLQSGQLFGETKPLADESAYLIQAELGTLRIVGTQWIFGSFADQVSAAIIEGLASLINNLNGSAQNIAEGMQLFIQKDANGAFVFTDLQNIDPSAVEAFNSQVQQFLAEGDGVLDSDGDGVPSGTGGGVPAGGGGGGGPAATGGFSSSVPAVDTSLLTPTPTEG